MAYANIPGGFLVPVGPSYLLIGSLPTVSAQTLDAANEAVIFIGQVLTSDLGSHTINTTGSSSIGWRTGAVTFANAGTTVKVGLAAVDTTNGPPVRAVNVADVITFDVNAAPVGGSGTITANAWQTTVPTTGSKTIAHGDFVALAVQMTSRAGADSVVLNRFSGSNTFNRPTITDFVGAAYASSTGLSNVVITFSDGAIGYFHGSDVGSALTTRTYNSGSATKEYGQLYNFPFPCNVHGIFGWLDPDADCDVILYSDPLGTPVAEKTISLDSNAVAAASGRRFSVSFATPYSLSANTNIGAVLKPGASNVSAYLKTLGSAGHRVADPWGTSGYGISRAAGAFADANSGLDHYYIGLILGAFDTGGSTGRKVQINDTSLVAS